MKKSVFATVVALVFAPFVLSSCATSKNILKFVDAHGGKHKAVINAAVEPVRYNKAGFIVDGDTMKYEGDERYTYRLGVDISRHDGEIDWKALRQSGREFVILRIAYRGYQSGLMKVDERFHQNIKAAQEAGFDVGVYVFSQAITEEEAAEEAEWVLRELKGYDIQLPVVFDPEHILDDDARTDNTPYEQFTKNALVFCRLVREAGYEPMVYCNMLWEAFVLDLVQLDGIQLWYADYEPQPQTPYHFTFWQYSAFGDFPYCPNQPTDLDIQLIPATAEQ